jgi:uncharacterized protein (TIGR03663 family)
LIKPLILTLCWLSVISLGAYLRFESLSKRPFHADEATGARITAARMEAGDYRFDPKHYHGPLLSGLAMPLLKLRGEATWQEMSKLTLRFQPALAGTLLLVVPWFWRRRFGDGPMLLAAAWCATSPLLVYYSRMFIHESLLVLFGMLALLSLAGKPRYALPGIFIGLMFATKESFAISILAWAGAACLVLLENRNSLTRAHGVSAWLIYRKPILHSVLMATLISVYCYSDGFRQPMGVVDAVKTFFVYETVVGHDKPFSYYFDLLVWPSHSAGLWWYGTPLVILALIAVGLSFRREACAPSLLRFIAYAALGHFLIYSLIGYKTPWLACLPWAHVCLLGGMAVVGFSRHRLPWKIALGMLIITGLASQIFQTRMATGRLSSDPRNPFAYVPTRGDVEVLEKWLRELHEQHPQGGLEPIAVIGSDYWPLPWYLRDFRKIGYWREAPGELENFPLACVMPEAADAVALQLAKSHVALPRGLRAGVPLHVFVRNDIWERWMNQKQN